MDERSGIEMNLQETNTKDGSNSQLESIVNIPFIENISSITEKVIEYDAVVFLFTGKDGSSNALLSESSEEIKFWRQIKEEIEKGV